MEPIIIGIMIGRTNPATPPKLMLKAAKIERMIPYAPITAPADAFFIFPINLAADSFKPFRSNVPVTNMIKIKIAIERFETKLVPSVFNKPSTPRPPVIAVTTAATKIIKIESNFNAKPIITIKIPINLTNSM